MSLYSRDALPARCTAERLSIAGIIPRRSHLDALERKFQAWFLVYLHEELLSSTGMAAMRGNNLCYRGCGHHVVAYGTANLSLPFEKVKLDCPLSCSLSLQQLTVRVSCRLTNTTPRLPSVAHPPPPSTPPSNAQQPCPLQVEHLYGGLDVRYPLYVRLHGPCSRSIGLPLP